MIAAALKMTIINFNKTYESTLKFAKVYESLLNFLKVDPHSKMTVCVLVIGLA